MPKLRETALPFASLKWWEETGDLRQRLLEATEILLHANQNYSECKKSFDADSYLFKSEAEDAYAELDERICLLREKAFGDDKQKKEELREIIRGLWGDFPYMIQYLHQEAVWRERGVLNCATRLAWGESHPWSEPRGRRDSPPEYDSFVRKLGRTPQWKQFTGEDLKLQAAKERRRQGAEAKRLSLLKKKFFKAYLTPSAPEDPATRKQLINAFLKR